MTAGFVDLAAFERGLAEPVEPAAAAWRVDRVRLAPGEAPAFRAACTRAGLALHDTIDRQHEDLAVVRLPGGTRAERHALIDALVAPHGGPFTYGTWVHYPWLRSVVHVLDADAYFEVITNRNHDKITRDEQRRLRTKRVGVLGLSVGGEATVALAQEHLCGTLVLADHDRLDLSNLNRLNAGCDELGLLKTTIVARRIARIDPYLDIVVHEDGVSDANADAFLDGLDLLVEECDDLPLKYSIRERARARGLDIVFAGDERGFLSIEPYADDPPPPLFHGRLAGPPPPREAYATPVAFMRSLAEWLGGWDVLSERSRRSLERLGSDLCGYPQLAGEARFASAQVAHAARRLLLGERLPASLGHLDLEAWLPGAAAQPRVGAPIDQE